MATLLDQMKPRKKHSDDKTSSTPSQGIRVLDVGCGVGGTSRHLARHFGCHVTGITISTRQVEIARRLTLKESPAPIPDTQDAGTAETAPIPIGNNGGSVTFIEIDAEKMAEYFAASDIKQDFDIEWISEALSHFPNKELFFQNAFDVLKKGSGKLVVADWFKAASLTEQQFKDDIVPIEEGMLLPPLRTMEDYVQMAKHVGFQTIASKGTNEKGIKDISQEVKQTWDITWSLIQSPSLWAFAFSQGRDGIAFLQAFRAMRRGYANGTFKYAVMAFQA